MTIIYTLTIFVSAFLLFLIQPMISKLMLPQLGGSPAVWNTSMMFFQMLLLAGYLYTHLSSKFLGIKKQSILHIVLLLLSLAWLPISLYTDIDYSSSEHPISWVVTSLFFSVGIPFFLLASNAPLIQLWMANTNHKDAQNPYFLYSASNIGSLLALLAYPFVIEPLFTLSQQTNNWSLLFVLFVALVSGCAWLMRTHFKPSELTSNIADSASAPTIKTRLYWIALAFAPSSLMLGVTTYITTDLASMPLFWIIPLAFYLMTFIFAFGNRSEKTTEFAIKAQNVLVPLLAWITIFFTPYVYISIAIHVITFFATAMVCHGTLAKYKPSTKYLTDFFVCMSFGGMLGGVFNTIVAPNIFLRPIEYTLVFILALFLRPKLVNYVTNVRSILKDIFIAGLFAGFIYAAYHVLQFFNLEFSQYLVDHSNSKTLSENKPISNYFYIITVVLFYVFVTFMVDVTKAYPTRFALSIALLMLALNPRIFYSAKSDVLFVERNFFGITSVNQSSSGDYLVRDMTHGTTLHGIQSLDPAVRLKPVSYYAPLIEIINNMNPELRSYPYAVLGLGAGTLACVGKKGQHVDFYEIDPAVIKMASNPDLFTYLQDCPTTKTVTLGDGRLELAKAEDHKYGLIVMDAFTSDAIPIHVITAEALQIYKTKLAKHGIIAINITNRYLDLTKLIAVLAKNMGMHAIALHDYSRKSVFQFTSFWMILTEDTNYYKRISKIKSEGLYITDMEEVDTSGISLWTDNYSNFIQVIK